MAKVIIEDIWVEDLFQWFSDHITNSGGDGAGVICCASPSEVADMFITWWKAKTSRKEFWHPRHEYIHNSIKYINFHDSNENYMFCDKEIDLEYGDYSFIIKKDCRFGWSGPQDKIVKALI